MSKTAVLPVQLGFLAAFAVGVASAGQRCDLVSRPEASHCLDLAKLDQMSIMVPGTTTRIPTDALVLCGQPASVPDPTDIVYVVDQTTSMKPVAILINGADTSGWYECNTNGNPSSPRVTYSGTRNFHGVNVSVIDASFTEATIGTVCSAAGDPFSARSTAIQGAIQTQADKAPASYAATINFSSTVVSTQSSMTLLSNPTGLSALLASVPNSWNSGTTYENPLTWARVLLYGGHSGATALPASTDAKKAVIFLSDGRPGSGTNWAKGLAVSASVKVGNSTWTTDSSTIPPVYGIFLGVDQVEGSVLDSLSKVTGGHYYQIPPNQPDSLGRVIQKILGELIPAKKPDGMTVVNQTNGQSSHAVKTTVSGNTYRMQLDSIVALVPGSNQVVLTTEQNGTPLSARLTIVVSDLPNRPTELDTLLTTRCDAASSLTVKPDVSGLAWADTQDRNLLLTLNTAPDQLGTLTLLSTTRVARDAETRTVVVDSAKSIGVMGSFATSIPWQLPTVQGVVVGDQILRSGTGWDTAIFTFAMPRDSRDTASTRLALRHPLDAPDSLVYFDADGDGALDKVVVHMRVTWKPGMELYLPWPDSSVLLDWTTARRELSPDSLTVTYFFAPQSQNITTARSTLFAYWRADANWEWQNVPVIEHIAPVPLEAHYRYSADGSRPDSLVVRFSEALRGVAATPWISIGHPGLDLLGTPLPNRRAPLWLDSSTIVFLVDSSDSIHPSDSLRLVFGGGLSDRSGNSPDANALWAAIEWGEPPPTLRVTIPHPVVKAPEADVPADEPAITVVLRDPNTGAPTAPSGALPEGLETRFGGPELRLNRIPKHMGLYIYDNLGVAVLSKDLSELSDMAAAGLLERSHRGDYVVWLAWDGKDAAGRPVSSGVYTFRVWGRFEVDGNLRIVNRTIKEGVFRRNPITP